MLPPRPESLWAGGSLGYVPRRAARQEFCLSGTQASVTGPEQVRGRRGVAFVCRTQQGSARLGAAPGRAWPRAGRWDPPEQDVALHLRLEQGLTCGGRVPLPRVPAA